MADEEEPKTEEDMKRELEDLQLQMNEKTDEVGVKSISMHATTYGQPFNFLFCPMYTKSSEV